MDLPTSESPESTVQKLTESSVKDQTETAFMKSFPSPAKEEKISERASIISNDSDCNGIPVSSIGRLSLSSSPETATDALVGANIADTPISSPYVRSIGTGSRKVAPPSAEGSPVKFPDNVLDYGVANTTAQLPPPLTMSKA